MSDHPSDATIEELVLGTLVGPELEAFSAHVSSCDGCAERLAREAKIELSLVDVAKEATARRAARPTIRARTRVPRVAVATAAALSLAAAIFLLVRAQRHRAFEAATEGSPAANSAPIPLVVCPDGPEQTQCVADAHRHGLFVSSPDWAGAPPLGGRRSPAGGPGAPPFSLADLR